MASIRQRSGRWQARVMRTGYEPHARSFLTRQDAERWARSVVFMRERDFDAFRRRIPIWVERIERLLVEHRVSLAGSGDLLAVSMPLDDDLPIVVRHWVRHKNVGLAGVRRGVRNMVPGCAHTETHRKS